MMDCAVSSTPWSTSYLLLEGTFCHCICLPLIIFPKVAVLFLVPYFPCLRRAPWGHAVRQRHHCLAVGNLFSRGFSTLLSVTASVSCCLKLCWLVVLYYTMEWIFNLTFHVYSCKSCLEVMTEASWNLDWKLQSCCPGEHEGARQTGAEGHSSEGSEPHRETCHDLCVRVTELMEDPWPMSLSIRQTTCSLVEHKQLRDKESLSIL